MPPKKAPVAAAAKTKADIPQNGLLLDGCALPFWDDADVERESFGDVGGAAMSTVADASSLFTDPEMGQPPVVDAFHSLPGVEWRRPAVIFSPFKPVVYRPLFPGNPYDMAAQLTVVASNIVAGGGSGRGGGDAEDDDMSSSTRPASRLEAIEQYRSMRAFRAHSSEDDDGRTGAAVVAGAGASAAIVGSGANAATATATGAAPRRGGAGHGASRRRERQSTATPFFMRAFNSALMALNHHQTSVPPGQYAWELIYPQVPGTHYPIYNASGKYLVKLFVNGAFRKVIIDDRLPSDVFGQCMFTVTEHKEIWPALLAKAILKVLGPQNEGLLFSHPIFVLGTLLSGWVPEMLHPSSDEILVYSSLRQAWSQKTDPSGKEPLILVAMCNDVLHDTTRMQRLFASSSNAPASGTTAATGGANGAAPGGGGEATPGSPGLPVHAAVNSDVQWLAAGLPVNQAYSILDVRPHNNTALVRLCSPNAAWRGLYAYESNAWTGEFESTIGFTVATDRNRTDLQRRWNDFWLPWESFVRFFKTFVCFRNVFDKRWGSFKTITCPSPADLAAAGAAAAADGAPKGGAAKAGAAPAAKIGAAASAVPLPVATQHDVTSPSAGASMLLAASVNPIAAPKTIVKWFFTDQETTVPALVVLHQAYKTTTATSSAGSSGGVQATPTSHRPATPAGLDRGEGIDTRITLETFLWNKSVPFRCLGAMTTPAAQQNSRILPLSGSGPRAFRLTVDRMLPGCAVSLLTPVDIVMGEERDIVRDALGVFVASDAGCFGDHVPGQPTLWLKRLISVKVPTVLCLALSCLTKGTDLAAHRTMANDLAGSTAAGGAGKGGAAAAAGAKGAAGGGGAKKKDTAGAGLHVPVDFPPEQYDESHHATSLVEYASLSLVDLDHGGTSVIKDTIGKILGAHLQPNKNGYALVAYACPPRNVPEGETPYGKGYWKLSFTTDRALETFEARSFDDCLARTGDYLHNDASSLFRYHLTTAEASTTSIIIRVAAASPSGGQPASAEDLSAGTAGRVIAAPPPFKATLLHNDKEIESRSGVGWVLFEHIAFLPPPDKVTPSVYSLQCTLDSGFTKRWELTRREHVVVRCREEFDAQKHRMLERQKAAMQLLQDNPTATNTLPPPSAPSADQQQGGATSSSSSPPSSAITFSLQIFSASTAKLELKEDHSISESVNVVKQSWVALDKKDGPAVPAAAGKSGGAAGAAGGKPAAAGGKGGAAAAQAAVIDDFQAHFNKAREARERFLANRAGVFLPIPAGVNGRTVPLLTPLDDPTGRLVAPASPQVRDASTRLHMGLSASGVPLHGGYSPKPPPSADLRGVPRSAPAADPQERDAATAASPPPRPVMAKLHEHTHGTVATLKELRRAVLNNMREAAASIAVSPGSAGSAAAGGSAPGSAGGDASAGAPLGATQPPDDDRKPKPAATAPAAAGKKK